MKYGIDKSSGPAAYLQLYRQLRGDIVTTPRSEVFCREALARLKDLLAEMDDPAQPFRRTTEADTCETCDFKMICGR